MDFTALKSDQMYFYIRSSNYLLACSFKCTKNYLWKWKNISRDSFTMRTCLNINAGSTHFFFWELNKEVRHSARGSEIKCSPIYHHLPAREH